MGEITDSDVNTSMTGAAHYGSEWMSMDTHVNGSSDYLQNYDYDYSSMEYLGEIKKVPAWEMSIKITAYSLIMCLALAGNLLIVVVVAKTKRMQTTTNYFIVNLAISDLLVTCCCTWVRLVDDVTEGWVLGSFFCKVNSAAQGKIVTEIM